MCSSRQIIKQIIAMLERCGVSGAFSDILSKSFIFIPIFSPHFQAHYLTSTVLF